MNPALLATGATVLAAVWIGPLPELARGSFAAHMVMHLAVIAIAASLIGAALARSVARISLYPGLLTAAAIAASVFELMVVWLWHMPRLHEAARWDGLIFLVEQGSFLFAGVLLWTAALAGRHDRRSLPGGIIALLMTSVHMTLLGAILALADRPLYPASCLGGPLLGDPVADQQVGGALMLAVGGTVYMAGGLNLVRRLLAGGAATTASLGERVDGGTASRGRRRGNGLGPATLTRHPGGTRLTDGAW